MQLYGKSWSRRELEARVGRIEQIGGVQAFVRNEGPEAGVNAYYVRTGAGLSYWVTPGKGMDIALAEYRGVPVSWSAANGEPHSSFYDARGTGWLRTASGGLLMTCGLTQVGSPGEDEEGAYGLHGRIHHTPARQCAVWTEWVGDEYEIKIRGVVEETSIFGERLRLTRELAGRLGDNRITIRDAVENVGFRAASHMMLYHFNFGFPLLAEDTKIELPPGTSRPRDPDMETSRMKEWQAPDAAFREQVVYHEPDTQGGGFVQARIVSPSFPGSAGGVTAVLEWDSSSLPRLVQWRMPGAGEHVLGLEPSNCWTLGRAVEREAGSLAVLAPGERVEYRLRVSFLE